MYDISCVSAKGFISGFFMYFELNGAGGDYRHSNMRFSQLMPVSYAFVKY